MKVTSVEKGQVIKDGRWLDRSLDMTPADDMQIAGYQPPLKSDLKEVQRRAATTMKEIKGKKFPGGG